MDYRVVRNRVCGFVLPSVPNVYRGTCRRRCSRMPVRCSSRYVEESTPEERHVIVIDEFCDAADELRQVYDDKFADPIEVSGDRFVWDFWHVPNQYTFVRTIAEDYFPPELYSRLEDSLLEFGERYLGCSSITTMWLSYYVSGCNQQLHADVPHGPWAFVLSLTKWDSRVFSGGETFLLRPTTLDYWRNFSSDQVLQKDEIVMQITPQFNRLTLFDPRFPHGVNTVHGTMNPSEARVVLHGWFTEPTPFFDGEIDADVAADCLNVVLEDLYEKLRQMPQVSGLMSVRMTIRGSTGVVAKVELLTNTLIAHPSEPEPFEVVEDIVTTVCAHLKLAMFPKAQGETLITLPLVFD